MSSILFSIMVTAFQNCGQFATEDVLTSGTTKSSSSASWASSATSRSACLSSQCIKSNLSGSLSDHLTNVPASAATDIGDGSKLFISASLTGSSSENGLPIAATNTNLQLNFTSKNSATDLAYQIYNAAGEQVQTYLNLKKNVNDMYSISLAHISEGTYSMLLFGQTADEKFVRTNVLLFKVIANSNPNTPNDLATCLIPDKQAFSVLGNYGEGISFTVPFRSTCTQSITGSRLNITNNTTGVSVRLASNNEIAFVGKNFEVTNSGFNDVLKTTAITSYGEHSLSLNYSFSNGTQAKTITINLSIHIDMPDGSVETTPGKLSCTMDGVDPATYTEAYQYKNADKTWTPCSIYKCATDHYFDNNARCKKLVIPTTCTITNRLFNWGSSATQSENCEVSIPNQEIAAGQSALVENSRSGFVGKQKVDCRLWKTPIQVRQVADQPAVTLNLDIPTLDPIASIGSNPLTETTCRKISWKSCSGSEMQSFEGQTYKFTPATLANGDNALVDGDSQDNPIPDKARRLYSCTDGRWLSKSVPRNYTFSPQINISKTGNGFNIVLAALSADFNYCSVAYYSLPNYTLITSFSMTPTGSSGNVTAPGSASNTEVNLYCYGQDVQKSISIRY